MIDNGLIAKDWIVLKLENTNTSFSDTIPLFDLGTNYNPTTQYTATIIPFVPSALSTWIVTTSTSSSIFSGNYQTMDDVVDAMNLVYQENGRGVFSHDLNITGDVILVANSLTITFLTVKPNGIPIVPFVAKSTRAIAGTTIAIESTINISVNELVQELTQQSYLLFGSNIYANSLAQANQEYNLTLRAPNGKQKEDFIYPAIVPMQKQFALENIEMCYTPSPTNSLNYTLLPSESVTLFFKYSGGSNDKYKEIIRWYAENRSKLCSGELYRDPRYSQLNQEPTTRIKNKIEMSSKRTNPVHELLYKHRPELRNVKNSVTKYIDPDRVIEDEEVYNAFLGTDYREEDGDV